MIFGSLQGTHRNWTLENWNVEPLQIYTLLSGCKTGPIDHDRPGPSIQYGGLPSVLSSIKQEEVCVEDGSSTFKALICDVRIEFRFNWGWLGGRYNSPKCRTVSMILDNSSWSLDDLRVEVLLSCTTPSVFRPHLDFELRELEGCLLQLSPAGVTFLMNSVSWKYSRVNPSSKRGQAAVRHGQRTARDPRLLFVERFQSLKWSHGVFVALLVIHGSQPPWFLPSCSVSQGCSLVRSASLPLSFTPGTWKKRHGFPWENPRPVGGHHA